jgi:hypothetical protein
MKQNDLRQIWEQRFSDFEASGQTVVAWCEQHQIKSHQFFYWRRRTRDVEVAQPSQPNKWLSMDYDFKPADPVSEKTITVQIGPISILVNKGFDPDLFLKIISILQSR